MWYRNPDKMLPNSYLGNQDKTRVSAVSMSYWLCYTREWVKREEKEIFQHLTTSHGIYLICHPRTIPYAPMYHLNVSSWSYTPPTQCLMNTTTPHRLTLQYHRPLPHLTKVDRHNLTKSSRHSCIDQHLWLTVTLISSTHSILLLSTIHTPHL